MDKTIGLRVNEHPEDIGLDLHEHAVRAYPEFIRVTNGEAAYADA